MRGKNFAILVIAKAAMINLFQTATVALLLVTVLSAPSVSATTLLTTKVWTGAGGDFDWHNPGNWEPPGAPGSMDDVIIDLGSGITVTYSAGTSTINSLNCAENLSISGGTLNINNTSAISGVFTMSNGTLGGSGELTILNQMEWTSGTMSGTGKVIIAEGALLSINAASSKVLGSGRRIENLGTTTWSDGPISVQGNGAGFTNFPGAVFNASANATMTATTGTSTFENEGTFNRSGTGTTRFRTVSSTVFLLFNNAGDAHLVSGGLEISGGGTNTGLIDSLPSTTLSIGKIAFTNASGSAFQCAGNVTLFADVTFNSDVTFSGVLTLGVSEFDPGTIRGPGTLTIQNSLNWVNGSMLSAGGFGTIVIANGATLDSTSIWQELLNRPLDNFGTITLGGNGSMRLGGGAWIRNRPGGLLAFGNGGLFCESDIAVVDNEGEMSQNGNGGMTSAAGAQLVLNNSGFSGQFAGTFTMDVQGTNSGTISGGGLLRFKQSSGNTFTHLAGSQLISTGTLEFSNSANGTAGVTNIAGTVNASGPVNIFGGTVNIDSNVSFPNVVTLNGALATLGGTGTVTIQNRLDWSRGTMSGTGKTVIPQGKNLNLLTANSKTLSRLIENSGITAWSAGMVLTADGHFANEPGGTFNATGNNVWRSTGGAANSFTNNGQFNLSGTGTTTFEVNTGPLVFNNDATMSLLNGSFSLSNFAQSSTGTFNTYIAPTTHGQLAVPGSASLAGTLNVQLTGGADPQPGQSLPLLISGSPISGFFDTAVFPFLGPDRLLSVQYGTPPMNGGANLGGTGVDIIVGVPTASPELGTPVAFALEGDPTGIAGAVFSPAATDGDLAFSVGDVDPEVNGKVLLRLNQGGGNAFDGVSIDVGKAPSGIASANLADGVEVDDIAVPNKGDNTVDVLFHNSNTLFSMITVPVGIAPSAITATDLNNDTFIDVAVTNEGSNTVTILLNNGDRTFTAQTPIAVGSEPASIAAGDLLGSTLPDLIVANAAGNTITVLENQGGGTYAPSTIPVGPTPIIVTPTDVDNDRDLDILISLQNGGGLAVVKNLGGGVLSNPSTMPMNGEPGSMDAWDMDADGDEDVMVVVEDTVLQEPVIRLLRNDGTSGQVLYTVFDPIAEGDMPQLVKGSDVSGDAVEDLVSVNATAAPLNGPGDFAAGPSTSSMSIRRVVLGALCRADVAPVGALDNVVGVPDLLYIINAWGPCLNPRNCPADIAPEGPPIGDDVVSVPDLLYIINNWGPCD